MEIFIQAVTAAAFCAAAAAVIWAVRGRLLAPGKCRSRILTVVRLTGGADDTEQLVLWLDWVRQSGGDMEIAVLSDGLSAEETRRARLLTERAGGAVVSSEELIQMIGDRLWQEKKAT